MKIKQRLDIALYERGMCESIEKAQALIMAGRVYTGERRLEKPGISVSPDDVLIIRTVRDYASRGALKFEKAIDVFNIDLNGVIAMDIGAAAGGFTDIMLRAGAKKVYAIDVGYGQMDWRLRNDPRVAVMERTNARYIERSHFPENELPSFCGMDVSFISVLTIFPAIMRVMEFPFRVVSLIKPQFEAPRALVGAKGVVREAAVHELVLNEVISGAEKLGLIASDITFSPVTGAEGNIEFLVEWLPKSEQAEPCNTTVSSVVESAHNTIALSADL